jgi:ribosomal protein L12E/L44/L45/RPP1/RPP2
VPRIPIDKKPYIFGCSYKQYKGSDKARITAENVGIAVQGTSSLEYVAAAPNLNVDFSKATSFVDNLSGKSLKESGWAMSDTAKPVDFFCTKVNVASAENANNALNQEWYNLF